MIRLLYSENLKIYNRKSTWVMLAILIFWTLFTVVSNRDLDNSLFLNIWGRIANQLSFIFLINLFTVIIASGIIANEFNWGTIKLLLIRPVRRGRVLLAKYLAVLLFGALLMTILFTLSLSINLLLDLFGKSGAGAALESVPEQKLWFNSLKGVILAYGLKYIEVVIYGTLALMLSALSKSNALTIGSVLMMMILGPELARLFAEKAWAKYILFNNLNLPQYLNGESLLPGMSMQFSLAVLGLYGVVFYMITWVVFVKQDVL
ncbi:MAG TPA: ABC transporter permease [Bacillota bacterium]|nr:ABC transporter permease [Bacillota bacterium]